MNRFAIIIPPVVILAAFMFFHNQFVNERDAKQKADQEIADNQRKAELEKKEKAARQAEQEAEQRRAEAKKLEDERIAKENADREEKIRVLKESTEKYETTGRGFKAEIARLQKELEIARNTRDKTAADALDLSLEVERARIAKRTADNEIQRLTELIQVRLSNSTFTQMPVAPAPKP